MRLIVDQSLAAGFISINTRQQRASLPLIHGSRGLHFHLYTAAEGFISINTRQQRASLPFKLGQGYLELCSVNVCAGKEGIQ